VLHYTIIFKTTLVSFTPLKKKRKRKVTEKLVFQEGVVKIFFQLWKFLQKYLFAQRQI